MNWKAVELRSCDTCGLVQRLPRGARSARCARCERSLLRSPSSATWTRALAATGLILYPFALHLPIMRVERFGRVSFPNIWDGTLTLLRDGELFVGITVFVCSVVFPLLKLVGLWFIAGPTRWMSRAGRGNLFRVIEWSGRFGMLDVLVLSLLVAVVKFTDWFEILPGPGALVFTACVLASLLAAAAFDPHTIWDDHA